jgi:hypothetical protein
MRDSTHTFLTPFQKPILVTHNEESEPIGRIIAAKYVDTSLILKDSVQSLVDKFNLEDKTFRNFINGNMEILDQVSYIQDTLYDKMSDDPNFEGLGYAEIVAHITDQAAIEKFLDKRYLTGSVSAGTDRAICSICKEDWSGKGRCEHTPGKVYDKKKAFLVGGKFTYEHWAVVNTPADGHSQAFQISEIPLIDSKEEESQLVYEIPNISIELLDSYSEEEAMKVIEPTETETVVVDETTPVIVEEKVVDNVETQDEVESLDDFLTRILALETKISDEDNEKLYQLMIDEMKESGLFDEKQLEDAVLSTEKRKKLAKSTFCGPGKSFPVPDCAHVTAARRLIGRYKGEGSKETILACVARKAKAMGCDKMEDSVPPVEPVVETKTTDEVVTTKDDMNHVGILSLLLEVVRANKWSMEENKPLTEEQLAMVQELISALAQLVTVEELSDAILSEKAGLSSTLSDRIESSLLDEVVKLETQLGEVRDENQNLKNEMSLTIKESETLRDSVISTKVELRKMKQEHLAVLKSLKDKKVVTTEELKTLEDSTLDTELDSLNTFKLEDVVNKLSDGMSRVPTESVENPMEVLDNAGKNETIITSIVQDELKHIELKYLELLERNSNTAKNYLKVNLERLKKEGKLP